MWVHEDFRECAARAREDEAERIAIRMGFHSAFLRATSAQRAARARRRARTQSPN
jgi:hypothetical protein